MYAAAVSGFNASLFKKHFHKHVGSSGYLRYSSIVSLTCVSERDHVAFKNAEELTSVTGTVLL